MTEKQPSPAVSTYDPQYFLPLFEAEDRHFWFRARNRLIVKFTRQLAARLRPDLRILEVGCGTGNVLRFLEKEAQPGKVIGMDLFLEGLRFARRRVQCALVQGDLHQPPFSTPFDLIGLFDVLEHMPDDRAVLGDLGRMLSDDGIIFISVPACPSLWSYFDEASHHQRRYTPGELAEKLSGAGFRVEYISYFMAGIFPLVWLKRRLTTAASGESVSREETVQNLSTGELRVFPLLNTALSALLSLEVWLLERRLRLPFGTSLVAVACKSGPA